MRIFSKNVFPAIGYFGISFGALFLTTMLAASLTTKAYAQSTAYPNKPIKFITPFSAGSGPDVALRTLTDKMSKDLGQPVLVENKPGGNGFIALQAAKVAPADGYTIAQLDDGHIALLPLLYKNIPYDMSKDFEAVGTMFKTYFFVTTAVTSPWKNMADLIGAAKAKPGEMNYGSWSIGSPGHIGGELLEEAAGLKMVHIPFKETPMVYQSVANGDVQWAFGTAGSSGPMYRAKKVKYLAIAAPKRNGLFPDVPTVAEAGGPANFELGAWVGLAAPKGTPAEHIARLNASIARALADPEVKEKFAGFGFETFTSRAQDIQKLIDADSKRFAAIVKRAKISIE
jgi:tripartite-type tricarboxylate transporter receptor subunit TctC